MQNINAFDAACAMLSARSRTEWEVRSKLDEKGYEAEAIDDAIAKLIAYHYLDDWEYIRTLVRSNQNGNQYGKYRLRQKLVQKHVARKYLNAFDDRYPRGLDLFCARAQAKKLAKRYDATDYKQRQKLYAALSRKGYSSDVISQVVGELDVR